MRNTFSVGIFGALAILGLSGTAATRAEPQSARAVVDVETLGPKVGDTVQDVTLPDQLGTPRALKSMMGPKGAVLVFFRSADW